MNAILMLFAALLAVLPAETRARDEKAQVMIVGVYHFESPNLDYVKSEKVDHLAEAKQKEIAEVLERLAKFKPTKIVLEATPDSEALQQRYAAFLADRHTLAGNEREQLGFRLARQFGHARVYMADHPSGMDLGAVLEAAKESGDQRFLAWFQGAMAEAQGLMERQARASVRDALVMLNEPELMDRTRDLYMQLARVRGGAQGFVGADVVANWYRRNFCIFANVAAAVESPQDRVLVLFGQGHAPYLRELVRSSPDLELVEANTYLKE